MENRLFTLTDQEKQYLETRTTEILKRLDGQASVSDCLRGYAAENGYSVQDAQALIDEAVIPTVDEYNASCRQAAEGDAREWMQERIHERVGEMSLPEEFRYKMELLRALHGLDREILSRVNLMEGQSWEESYAQLCGGTVELPADGDITPDMLERLNNELAETIENSNLPLYHSAAFQELVDSQMDQESVKSFVFEMWKDEVYKYCTATAACVAHHNGELPSIEAETPAQIIVLGVCQGVDIENVERKAASGEVTADFAFELLRIASMVALVLLGVFLLKYMFTAALVGTEIVAFLMGGGVMAFLASTALTVCVVFGALDIGIRAYGKVMEGVYKFSEVAYHAVKRGAQNLYRYASEQILPKIQDLCHRALHFMETSFTRIRRQFSQLTARA